MARPTPALLRGAMAAQRPLAGPAPVAFDLGGLRRIGHVTASARPLVRLNVAPGKADSFLVSPAVIGALGAGAAVIATCETEADAEHLRREITGSAQ